jgi:alpha-beta hydrolase superfamily lysophospholipase
MPAFLRKTLKTAAFVYGLSLPAAFLVGGAMYSRPIRTPVPARALAERIDPEWSANFLRGHREVQIGIEPKVRFTANLFAHDSSVTVILLHSSGGNRLDCLPIAYRLWQSNIGSVMLDRRAHGSSEGESQPLFLDETDDLVAALDWLIEERVVGTSAIGVIGIGDAATSALLFAAADSRVDAVAAIEPATTATEYVSRRLAAWCGLPRPIVWPQSTLAVRAMALFAGVDSSHLDARPGLAAVAAPAIVFGGDDPLTIRDARTASNTMAASKVELVEAPAEADGYDALISFFERNL